MTVIGCPKCGRRFDAVPGQDVVCPQCGFTAPLKMRPPTTAVSASPPPASRDVSADAPEGRDPRDAGFVPAPFAYVAGVVGLVTFWLAALVVPFLLGIGAVALGILGRKQDPSDRRSVPAIALGAAAIVAAAVFLAVA